jgi:hypothetical protein
MEKVILEGLGSQRSSLGWLHTLSARHQPFQLNLGASGPRWGKSRLQHRSLKASQPPYFRGVGSLRLRSVTCYRAAGFRCLTSEILGRRGAARQDTRASPGHHKPRQPGMSCHGEHVWPWERKTVDPFRAWQYLCCRRQGPARAVPTNAIVHS